MAGARRWKLRGAIAADGHALLVLFTPRLVASEAATSTIVRLAQKSGKVKTSSKMGRAEGLKSADGRPRRNVAPAAGLPHCTISPAFAATRTFPSARGRSIARTIVPFFGAGAGQRLDALLIGGELFGGAGIDDAAVVEHEGIVGDGEAHARVLFDQQDRDALRAHLRNDAEHLAHHQRRQPLRWLVEDQQPRVEQQRPADRQHLLLAPGELSAAAQPAFGEAREELIDAGDRPWTAALERHLEVLLDAEVGEDAAALRHIAHAQRGDAECR